MVNVVVAPDGFGGTLTATEAAGAIADGWRRSRPDDRIVSRPMSDGGEGLLAVLGAAAGDAARWHTVEVAGPLGHPVEAHLLERADGEVVIESAQACGLHLLDPATRDPLRTTTYGVGQLLDAARRIGSRRLLVGLGGSASVDGGAGALTGLGFRLRVADGSGLKIGGGELHRVARAGRGWAASFADVEVVLLADVTATLADAAPVFGPQKGASDAEVAQLDDGLRTWAGVAHRDLWTGGAPPPAEWPGSGAAGGLGFGLIAGLGAQLVAGSTAVAAMIALDAALDDADVVLTGEGRLDATTTTGKVVAHVAARSRERAADAPVLAVVGRDELDPGSRDGLGLHDVEPASPQGPGDDPADELADAAARIAGRFVPRSGARSR